MKYDFYKISIQIKKHNRRIIRAALFGGLTGRVKSDIMVDELLEI